MQTPDEPLKADDFARCPWEEVIAQARKRACPYYYELLRAEAQQSAQSGDRRAEAVYRLLANIAFLGLVPDSGDIPFQPTMVLGNRRSFALEDLSDTEVNILKGIAPGISDAEMRARVHDVLWVMMRDYQMAETAIQSYLKSARNLEPGADLLCIERLQRAIRLAASLGTNRPCFAEVVGHIEEVLRRCHEGESPSHLSARLMEMLQDYRQGDPAAYAKIASRIAKKSEGNRRWPWARRYFEIAGRWFAMSGDSANERDSLISAAETYVGEAEDAIGGTGPNYTTAKGCIERAIQALRQAGKTQERIEELHRMLLEYQEKSLGEMTTIRSPGMDAKWIDKARRCVSGKDLLDAIVTLASMGQSPTVGDLRKGVHERAETTPFSYLAAAEVVNHTGKTTGRKPSPFLGKAEEVEKAERDHMLMDARFLQGAHVQGTIEPARQQIALEHWASVLDFLPIVHYSPFVPPGREFLYARGFRAGLVGDFVTATHLLIPQVENSIRHVLSSQGVITSGLDDDCVQDEFTLEKLLYLPKMKDVFGDDLTFDLQGLLVERFGANLRNRIAHGLIQYDGFVSADMSYLWWLTLRICCLPILRQIVKSQGNSAVVPGESESRDAKCAQGRNKR